jgi:hypothetical protein
VPPVNCDKPVFAQCSRHLAMREAFSCIWDGAKHAPYHWLTGCITGSKTRPPTDGIWALRSVVVGCAESFL